MTKRFKFEKECTENFFTEKGVFYYNERPMGANEIIALLNSLYDENEQLKQEIKQYWKCRDKWKQEAKEFKKEADYFERKKCEYWNMYNEAHSDRIILKKENEELRHELDSLTGCYCADNKEFKDYWRIGYGE